MKKIETIVNPSCLDEMKDDLIELGAKTITATEVKGFSRMWTHTEIYRGTKYSDNSVHGIKLEVLLEDEQLEDAVLILMKGLEPGSDEASIIVVPVEPVPEYLACARVAVY